MAVLAQVQRRACRFREWVGMATAASPGKAKHRSTKSKKPFNARNGESWNRRVWPVLAISRRCSRWYAARPRSDETIPVHAVRETNTRSVVARRAKTSLVILSEVSTSRCEADAESKDLAQPISRTPHQGVLQGLGSGCA